jgi:hypothetical protein
MNERQIRLAAEQYVRIAAETRPDDILPTFAVLTAPNHYVRSPGLPEYRQALVLSGEWFVIAQNNVFSDGFVQTPKPPHSAYLAGYGPEGRSIGLVFDKDVRRTADRAFLLGGCRNYSHWLLDYLPRLHLLEDRAVPLLINQDPAPFQIESLALLGIERSRLVELAYPGAYAVDRLLYPALASSGIVPPHALRPAVLEWLRAALLQPQRIGRTGRRLFVSRGGESSLYRRRLINHAEIIDIALGRGFEIVEAEKLPIAEQIRLFAEASIVAGPHGAGLTNIVFAPRGMQVVELIGPAFGKTDASLIFVRIAAQMGQDLQRVLGTPVPGGGPAENHLPNETYAIDALVFERTLDRAIASAVSP